MGSGGPFDLSPAKLALLKRLRDETARPRPTPSDFELSDSDQVSSAQRQLWLHEQTCESGFYPYNQSISITISGPLEVEALRRAFDDLIRRHSALRTTFAMRDGTLRRTVHHHCPALTISVLDSVELLDAELENLSLRAGTMRFALDTELPVRAQLLCTKIKTALHLTFHHIAADGLSMSIIHRELSEFYAEQIGHPRKQRIREYPLLELIALQASRFESDDVRGQLAYWILELKGELPQLKLPCDTSRLGPRTYKGQRVSKSLSRPLVVDVQRLARLHQTTPFAVFLAAFKVTLFRYTHEGDCIVGIPLSGRTHPAMSDLVGNFVNPVVSRTALSSEKQFDVLIADVERTLRRALANDEVPFETLVSTINPPRCKNSNPIFQTLFGIEDSRNAASVGTVEFGAIKKHFNGTSKFDLEVNLSLDDDAPLVQFDYDADIFDPATVERMLHSFVSVVEQVVADPSLAIGAIDIVSVHERQLLLHDWNSTDVDFPRDTTLHELFGQQVARTPERIAIETADGRTLSYRELDAKSNQVARLLRDYEVSADEVVAICFARSFDMLIAVLGVLKAGGAYLPLDPDMPTARLNTILEDSRVKIALVQRHLREEFDRLSDDKILILEIELATRLESESLVNVAGPNSLAYVMYTSGSTGRPKGVMLEHRAVVNRVVAMQPIFFRDDDVVLQNTRYTFDVSFNEIFCALCFGAKLLLPDADRYRSIGELKRLLKSGRVTLIEAVPSLLRILLQEPDITVMAASLRVLISSGEALPMSVVAECADKLPHVSLFNVYGPTETGEVTYWKAAKTSKSVLLGRPLSNVKLYILDNACGLVPVGVHGEICIGGEALARGYLNSANLTAERFVANPFVEDGIMYKTGDIGRYLSDSNVEYIGRNDDQLKIRGNRVELREVEHALRTCIGIRDAACLAVSDSTANVHIVSYVVLEPEAEISDVKAALSRMLPDYMMPSEVALIDELPSLSNGKIDYRALRMLPRKAANVLRVPNDLSALERRLASIWCDILGCGEVSKNSDFFELGGDSLFALEVLSRIEDEFGVELQTFDLFEAPTLAGLADRIRARSDSRQV